MKPDDKNKKKTAGEAKREAALPDEKLEGVAGGHPDGYDACEVD